jgi:hypothetical protein
MLLLPALYRTGWIVLVKQSRSTSPLPPWRIVEVLLLRCSRKGRVGAAAGFACRFAFHPGGATGHLECSHRSTPPPKSSFRQPLGPTCGETRRTSNEAELVDAAATAALLVGVMI